MITVGVDEVGRGCWAGPLVAGAVILSQPIAGLRDSKKLSKLRREKLAQQINLEAAAASLGWVSSSEIDRLGLTKSVALAMRRALDGIEINYDEIIIDGHYNFLPDAKNVKLLVKADDLIPCVGAASIIAKVARDNWMAQTADKKFPEYFFNKHVGYGTKLHLEMLKIYGTSELHRQSFKPVKLINETALSK